jgi:hypothetical protein
VHPGAGICLSHAVGGLTSVSTQGSGVVGGGCERKDVSRLDFVTILKPAEYWGWNSNHFAFQRDGSLLREDGLKLLDEFGRLVGLWN